MILTCKVWGKEMLNMSLHGQYSPEPCDGGFPIGCCVSSADAGSSELVKRISSKQPVALPPGMIYVSIISYRCFIVCSLYYLRLDLQASGPR